MSGPTLCRQPVWRSSRHSCPAYSHLLYFSERKGKFTLLSDHYGSLPVWQPLERTSTQQASQGTAFGKSVCIWPRLVADTYGKQQCPVLCVGPASRHSLASVGLCCAYCPATRFLVTQRPLSQAQQTHLGPSVYAMPFMPCQACPISALASGLLLLSWQSAYHNNADLMLETPTQAKTLPTVQHCGCALGIELFK